MCIQIIKWHSTEQFVEYFSQDPAKATWRPVGLWAWTLSMTPTHCATHHVVRMLQHATLHTRHSAKQSECQTMWKTHCKPRCQLMQTYTTICKQPHIPWTLKACVKHHVRRIYETQSLLSGVVGSAILCNTISYSYFWTPRRTPWKAQCQTKDRNGEQSSQPMIDALFFQAFQKTLTQHDTTTVWNKMKQTNGELDCKRDLKVGTCRSSAEHLLGHILNCAKLL